MNHNAPSRAAAAPAEPPVAAPEKPRFVGIDIVKILAVFLVVCIHFFLYNGFYAEPITATFGQKEIIFRWVAYCCVPLFMIVTGYLMKNKTLSKSYYKGILRVLIIYLVISVICWFFDMKIYPHKYDPVGGYSLWQFVRGLFMFSDAQYAWYVEYYFCMFLLIPFINTAFHALKSQKERQIMVITVFALSVLSQSFYVGINEKTQFHLFPGYFIRFYPIALYLVGAYIREYPPKRTLMNKICYFIGYCVCLAWASVTTYQHSLQNADNNYVMYSRHYNDYGSWPVCIMSICLFLLLFDISSKNKIVCKVLKVLSNATFACYLISYVFDTKFYQTIVARHPTMPDRFSHWYEYIPKVFGCAMLCGLVIEGLYELGQHLIVKAARKKAAAAEAKAEEQTD